MAGASRVVWAALVALLALVAVAGASILTLFDGNSGIGCVGNTEVISCGKCQNIKASMRGGYYFLDTGASGYLYSSTDCAGSPAAVLTEDLYSCSGVPYKSVYIACSISRQEDITAPK